jgi:NADPH:quinone reductase-like Zn-dependent oxidoreductase
MIAVLPGEASGARVAHITKIPVPVPVPGSGEVLIKVAAAGVNRGDLAQVAGMYPPPPGAPQTLGLEVSGTIASVAVRTVRWSVGDKVCALVAGGGYAEYASRMRAAFCPFRAACR